MKRIVLLGLLVVLPCVSGCFATASSRQVCDDLRESFAAKSNALGCGIATSYSCVATGGGSTCSEESFCQSAIDDAPDCGALMRASHCSLTCDPME